MMHSFLLVTALAGVHLGLAAAHDHGHRHTHARLHHASPAAAIPGVSPPHHHAAALVHPDHDDPMSKRNDPLQLREAGVLHVNPDGSVSEHPEPRLQARAGAQSYKKKIKPSGKVAVPNCNPRYMALIRTFRPRRPKQFCANYSPRLNARRSPIPGFPSAQALYKACGCFLRREAALTANAQLTKTTTKKMTAGSQTVSAQSPGTTDPSSSAPTSSAAPGSSTNSQLPDTATSAVATAPAPAQTGAGTVAGCTKWYVAVPGDYCYLIATNYNIPVDTFMSWNPSVNPPTCNTLYAGYAYCVATTASASSGGSAESSAGSSAAAGGAVSVAPSSAASDPAGQPSSYAAAPTGNPSTVPNSYTMYKGDGTVAQGWPAQSSWLSYDQMWESNMPIMQQSCANWNVPLNSATEIAYLNSSIQTVAAASGVDARFILAIVLQESNACVRVITTAWGHSNPGLMQSNQGAGSCNMGGTIQNPCPQSEILQMIKDGTQGTASGDGLQQCITESGSGAVDKYYKAARIYNGGLAGWDKTNLGAGCCTKCYSSDVANRLTGWHAGVSGCTL